MTQILLSLTAAPRPALIEAKLERSEDAHPRLTRRELEMLFAPELGRAAPQLLRAA